MCQRGGRREWIRWWRYATSEVVVSCQLSVVSCRLSVVSRRHDGNAVAGPEIRGANAGEEAGLHHDCRANSGAGDRREHGDLERVECRAAAATAVSLAGAVDGRVDDRHEGECRQGPSLLP